MKYDPSPWGREYHSLQVDEALGGGSAGPGKSMCLLMDPLDQVVVEHQRCVAREINWGESRGWAIHFRKEFPRLEQTIERSKMLFPRLDPNAKYDPGTHKWTWSSGYKYQFAHLSTADAFMNYRSNEYTHVGFDELTEIEHQDMYSELVLRCRTTDPVLQKMRRVRAMTNPGAGWVRDYFVEPAPNGRTILKKRLRLSDGTEEVRTRMFLPARLSDNPDAAFRRDYEVNLRDKPAHIRAALLDGDWYVVAGAFFAEAWDPSRVVVKRFAIPANWRRFRSGDWGYKQPCVILWWAISPEGEMICYRERTFNGPKARELLDARGVAEAIKDEELAAGEWNRLRNVSRLSGVMDNQLWEERGQRGMTMAQDMAAVGVHWSKATKGRKQAAQQIIKRLKQRGYNDRPGIMFFEHCVKCIATIPALGTDDMDPEVPRKGGPDHWYDAVSYAAAACPLPNAGEAERAGAGGWDEDEDEPARAQSRGKFGYGGN